MSRAIVSVAALFAIFAVGSCTDSTEPQPRVVVLQAVTAVSVTGVVGAKVEPAPSVVAVDGDGKPVAGVRISFRANGQGWITNFSSMTGADGTASVGTWTLGSRSGTQTIDASSPGLEEVVFAAVALPGPVASLKQMSGDNQMATVGYVLPQRLRVLVADEFGNPIGGARVTFEIRSGNGSIDTESVVADPGGVATSSVWRLGLDSGIQQVTARSEKSEVVFTAEALPLGLRQPRILFVHDDQIYSFDVGTSITTQITDDGKNYYPAISPDGRRIAFVRFSSDWVADIYVMDADGSNVSRRTTGLNFSFPSWSPDGQTLAVATARMPYWGEIYLLSAVDDGTSPVKIADDASMPAWSPDGKRIAFVSLSGDDGYHALHLANADGSAVTEIVGRAPHAIDDPTWSPDGGRIAFSRCDQGTCDVYVVTSAGAPVWKTEIGFAVTPAWSPDGRWIAFTLWKYGQYGPRIGYTRAQGGGEVTVISDGRSPAW